MGKPQHHWRAVAREIAREIAQEALVEYRRGLALPPQAVPVPSTDESVTETAAEPEPPQGAA